jgi:hypothetical protein
MKQFKVRCSSLGIVCAKKGFGQTGKTAIKKQVMDMIYDRQHQIKSKYLTKGNACEDESILALNKMLGLSVEKNTERFYNEWITGEPDYIGFDFVRDVKNSYSHDTFPLLDDDLDYNYEMQVKGYLWLLDKSVGYVDYFLNDMPENLLMKECYAEMRNRDMEELEMDLYNEIKERYTYSDLPLKMRYRSFRVELAGKDIEFMKANCELANAYGNELLTKHYGL